MYRVRIKDGKLDLVNQDGNVVPNSMIKSISFPVAITSASNGNKHYPIGDAKSEIEANGKSYSMVPVYQEIM